MKRKVYLSLTYICILFININALHVANAVRLIVPAGPANLEEDVSAEKYIDAGIRWQEMGQDGPAIMMFTAAINLNPTHDAFVSRGLLYLKLSKNEEALADFTEAIILNARSANAFFNRARAYKKLGEYEKFLADYNEAVKLNPEFANAEDSILKDERDL